MNVVVNSRSKEKKEFVHACASYFVNYLNLNRSKYLLTVNIIPRLKLNLKVYGQTYKVAHRHIYIDIDSKLEVADTIGTLAHEMVHVRQFALGHLRYEKNSYGNLHAVWRGKKVKKKYLNQPWEIEAFTMEPELSESLMNKLAEGIEKL